MSPRTLLILCPIFAGCSIDYGIASRVDAVPSLWTGVGGGPPGLQVVGDSDDDGQDDGSGNLDGEGTLEARLDVAFQRNRWGTNVSRCQVELAFEERFEDTEGGGSGGGGTQLEMPTEPGQCAVTHFELEEDDEPHEDNWYESGEVFGPDEVFLVGDLDELRLDLVASEDGKLRYELSDCNEDTFPFGQVLDLDIPGSDAGDLEAWVVPEALVVGAEVWLTEPTEQELDANTHLVLEKGDDLVVAWESLQDDPITADGAIAPREDVRVQNALHKGPTVEMLVCLNEERGRVRVPAEVMAELSFNPADIQEYDTNFDVHLVTEGPEWQAPWGQAVRVRSTISVGGSIYLEP